MSEYPTPSAARATRRPFVESFPCLKFAHRAAQSAMFAAANRAGLSRDDAKMREGCNAALMLMGPRRIESRRELSIVEMQTLTLAIESGMFDKDWNWGHQGYFHVQTRVGYNGRDVAEIARVALRDAVTMQVLSTHDYLIVVSH